jgi:hypothetical protein
MAGISPRTLHYYDSDRLLVAERQEKTVSYLPANPLLNYSKSCSSGNWIFHGQIREILSPESLYRSAFLHIALIAETAVRIDQLIATIDKTCNSSKENEYVQIKNIHCFFGRKNKKYDKRVREQYGDEPVEPVCAIGTA